MMRTQLVVWLLLLFSCSAFAQKNDKFRPYSELSAFIGTSYYNGEINPERQLPSEFLKPALGIQFRRNFSRRYAFRLGGYYGNISASDSYSSDPVQQQRNLRFQSKVIEGSGIMEFNYLPFEVGHARYKFSPYVFLGLAGFYFNPQASVNGEKFDLQDLRTEGQDGRYSRFVAAVPFGMGIKFAPGSRLSVGLEWGFRKTYTDYLDDISGRYGDSLKIHTINKANGASAIALSDPGSSSSYTREGRQRGTSRNKDWYSFFGITLSFRFDDPSKTCAAYPKKPKVLKFLPHNQL